MAKKDTGLKCGNCGKGLNVRKGFLEHKCKKIPKMFYEKEFSFVSIIIFSIIVYIPEYHWISILAGWMCIAIYESFKDNLIERLHR